MDPSSPRQEEKLELAVRAAWLYHVAGNTQHEIARKLQISRPTAQRLVAFALERGLIKVRVNHKVASCLELAVALRQRYNLAVCDVVPVNADSADQILRKIAVAAAQVMESYINEVQPKIIALGSGQTIKAVVGELNMLARPQHRLLSLVGTIARDGSSNPYDAALQAAEKIGAKCSLARRFARGAKAMVSSPFVPDCGGTLGSDRCGFCRDWRYATRLPNASRWISHRRGSVGTG
jgi:DNA-binding transcriptional regulator LsrR (DeoR family)